jgi:DNA-binding transcriptional MerR regulator
MMTTYISRERRLYKIGDVSKISGISCRTLRLYDDLGLVEPDLVDDNKYRYYSLKTILTIPVINYFKMMGFSLDEISAMLKCADFRETKRHFTTHLELCDNEERRIAEQRQAIYEWEKLIDEASNVLSVDQAFVNVKFQPKIDLLCMPHHFMGEFAESIISPDFGTFVKRHNNTIMGPVILKFHAFKDALNAACDGEECEIDLLQEAMRPIDDDCRISAGGRMFLSTYHCGKFEDMGKSFERMAAYSKDNKYKLSNEVYERFVTDYWTTYDPNLFVVEILIPIDNTN